MLPRARSRASPLEFEFDFQPVPEEGDAPDRGADPVEARRRRRMSDLDHLGPHGEEHLVVRGAGTGGGGSGAGVPLRAQHRAAGKPEGVRLALLGDSRQQVHLADETGHERVGRPGVELQGGADLLEPALVQDGHPVGDGQRFFLVVGDPDRRRFERPLQTAQERTQFTPQRLVEARERFVEEQHLRTDGERPGDGHPLLLPSRNLAGIPVRELEESHPFQHLVGEIRRLTARYPAPFGAERNVPPEAQVGEEGVALEDHSHVPVFGRGLIHQLAPDPDLSRVRFQVPGDAAEDGGLAGSAGAEQGHQFSASHPQRHVRHGVGLAEALAESFEGEPGVAWIHDRPNSESAPEPDSRAAAPESVGSTAGRTVGGGFRGAAGGSWPRKPRTGAEYGN